ncbi:hypothetical protein BDB01DRAFT_854571 [Pilobolus umbonatus]|nr:hypothetical protein BDB01DRAFT_854571 [Pilobolus umbonatus]
MEQPPIEIFELIIDHLDPLDYYHCSTVNRYWYNMIIPFLYTNVSLKDDRQHMLFINSMRFYPRSIEAGYYVKEFSFRHLYYTDGPSDHTNEIKTPVDALQYFPNIEILRLPNDDYPLQCLLANRVPVLKSLKKITFRRARVCENTGRLLMKCYYKFRASLTYLNLRTLQELFNRYTLIKVTTFLQSFPRLAEMDAQVPPRFIDSPFFDTLVSHCPTLTRLNYCGYKMNNQNISDTPFPQLKSLTLVLSTVDLEYAYYIRRKFTSLTHLVVEFEDDYTENPGPFFTQIMPLKTLQSYTIKFNRDSEVYNNYWIYYQQFLKYPVPDTINRIHFLSPANACYKTSLVYDKNEGIRTVVVIIPSTPQPPNAIYKKLEKIGDYIDMLKIHCDRYQPMISFQKINDLCPQLTHLHIADCQNLEPDPLVLPNYNMKSLKLGRVDLENRFYREIEQGYPSLHELTLTLFSVKRLSIQLPTSVRLLTLRCPRQLHRHVLVLKEVKRRPVKAWHLDFNTNAVIITEHEEASVVEQRSNEEGFSCFRSSTLEVAFITQIEDFFWVS